MKTIALLTIDLFKIGGTERVVSNLANLFSAKYKVIIVSCYKQKEIFYMLNKDVQVKCLSMDIIPDSFIEKIIWYRNFIRAMKLLAEDENINYLIATTHALNSMLPFIRTSTMKIIGCEHIVYSAVPKLYSLVRRIMYPYLDAIVVLTQSAKRHYEYHSNINIIPNFISEIPEVTSDLKSKNVLAIGRYDFGKSFDRLIQIAALVKNKGGNVLFRIIGEGERREEFQELIRKLNLEDIVFLIPPTKDVKSEYLNSSLYLMTSRSEALPMVLLEAKSYGIPIISFECQEGPISLINNSVDGFLIEDNNFESFADKIVYLMTHENERIKMGKESRKSLGTFHKNVVEQQWEQLLTKI